MPKGHTEPHTVTCHNCGTEFTTTRIGIAGRYCTDPMCEADRKGKERETNHAAARRSYRAKVSRARRTPEAITAARRLIVDIARAAEVVTPTDANLRRAITAYRTAPSSGTAKLIAAAALALAADLASVEQQLAA